MPFRIVLHNDNSEEDYVRVQTQNEVSSAISKMVFEKEDWRDGDSIVVFKITDVEAKNEDFCEGMMADMRKSR